jgi:hypothetical protein
MRVVNTEPHRFPDFEAARHGRFSQPRASAAGKVLATLRPDPPARAKLEHWRTQLKHHPRLERANNVTLREATTIGALISDLDRVGRLLDRDIAIEEQLARVFDPFNAAYPILARAFAARRANLKETIATLEKRLTSFVNRTEPLLPA